MCYQVRQTSSKKDIERRFSADFLTVIPDYQREEVSGFTHPKMPVIANSMVDKIQLFQWGLIPQNQKNTLNARIETIREKPSFRNFVNQKCLILVNGFYEWKHVPGERHDRHKYLLSLPDNGSFALAGLWSEWEFLNGEKYRTFTVITTEAQGIMREIHNTKLRMPVILKREIEMDWLMGKRTAKLHTDLVATKIFPLF